MKLLLDQGLPRTAAALLRNAGVDAVHTSSPNVVATSVPSTVNALNPRGLANLSFLLHLTPKPLSPLDAQTLVIPGL
jgi:hypothetical protein